MQPPSLSRPRPLAGGRRLTRGPLADLSFLMRDNRRVTETPKRADTSEWSRPLQRDRAQNEPPCLPKMPIDEASQQPKK